jgi:hypothetical protein
MICSIPGCNNKRAARGWCMTHYTRWRRTGDPLKMTPPEVRARKPRVVTWKPPLNTPRRRELDHLRQVLCDAFMGGDMETYGKAARALREMIGWVEK